MAESGNHHLKRSDRIIHSQIRRDLEAELGRRLDYRDQVRIDAELAKHGIHFHETNEETVKEYVQEAARRGISHRVRGRRDDNGRTGD